MLLAIAALTLTGTLAGLAIARVIRNADAAEQPSDESANGDGPFLSDEVRRVLHPEAYDFNGGSDSGHITARNATPTLVRSPAAGEEEPADASPSVGSFARAGIAHPAGAGILFGRGFHGLLNSDGAQRNHG